MSVDLKHANPDGSFPAGRDEQALTQVMDWSQEEEVRAKRKLDLIIMPLLTLGFFCLRTPAPPLPKLQPP